MENQPCFLHTIGATIVKIYLMISGDIHSELHKEHDCGETSDSDYYKLIDYIFTRIENKCKKISK